MDWSPLDDVISRRRFLQGLGMVGGAATIALNAPLRALAAMGNSQDKLKVIVVGAGLAGLCSAYELEQRGHEVVILEANTSRIGGRVYTHHFKDGSYGEFGAMRIPETHSLTRHYMSLFQLPLRPFVQSNGDAFYYARGHKVRNKDVKQLNQYYDLAPAEQGKGPGDFWHDAILSILEQMSPEELADLSSPMFQTAAVQAFDRLSLREVLMRAGLSDEAIELVAVLWAYEPTLNNAVTEILRTEHQGTWGHGMDELEGGMERFPFAFADHIKAKATLGAEVVRIQRQGADRAAAVYIDHRDGNRERRVEGDALICTVPLGIMKNIEFTPALSGPKARAARQVTYDSSTKVLFKTSRRFWEIDDNIYGGGTYTDLPTAITYYPANNAVARDPAVSKSPAVMLASYSWGQGARQMAALTHKQRFDLTKSNLAKIHPQLLVDGVITGAASWSWDNNPHSLGAFPWFAPGEHQSMYRYMIEPEGNLFFAGEHASLTHSWMQGALESAVRAVGQLLGAP